MSLREVKFYKASNEFIQKSVSLKGKIPLIKNLDELKAHKKDFTKSEYMALYQQFAEIKIYDEATWEERKLLAPLLDYFYDKNNSPVLIYPCFEPLVPENEEFRFDEEEVIIELQKRLARKGMSDEEIGLFVEGITEICDIFDLNDDDCLLNLNNIGWSDIFGPRIIDWGLTNDLCKEYYG